jgi:hypothetical protein
MKLSLPSHGFSEYSLFTGRIISRLVDIILVLPSILCACNIVSVKVQSTSKPALRPMERSGIGLSAGRRPLQEPETGLVGARP